MNKKLNTLYFKKNNFPKDDKLFGNFAGAGKNSLKFSEMIKSSKKSMKNKK